MHTQYQTQEIIKRSLSGLLCGGGLFIPQGAACTELTKAYSLSS